jgi:hypothetical protein
MALRGQFFPGRLESVLDRSWEVQPVTWSQLTWWDPIPCGQLLMGHLQQEEFSLYFPSPALSMLNNPPTPQKRRKMQPTQLNFQASSPIPAVRRSSLLSNSSGPLAWPLPPSPDSFSSVFLPNSSPDCNNNQFSISSTHSPTHTKRSFTMVDSMLRRASSSLLPTPPDSSEGKVRSGQRSLSYRVFNFPMPPPSFSNISPEVAAGPGGSLVSRPPPQPLYR